MDVHGLLSGRAKAPFSAFLACSLASWSCLFPVTSAYGETFENMPPVVEEEGEPAVDLLDSQFESLAVPADGGMTKEASADSGNDSTETEFESSTENAPVETVGEATTIGLPSDEIVLESREANNETSRLVTAASESATTDLPSEEIVLESQEAKVETTQLVTAATTSTNYTVQDDVNGGTWTITNKVTSTANTWQVTKFESSNPGTPVEAITVPTKVSVEGTPRDIDFIALNGVDAKVVNLPGTTITTTVKSESVEEINVGAGGGYITNKSGFNIACPNLTKLVLGDGVQINKVTDGSKLTSLTLGKNLTCGANTFTNCTALETVDLNGNSPTGNMFSGCTSLKTVWGLGPNVGKEAFKNCTNLATCDFSNVETIGDYAFQNTGFDNLDLPKMRTIGEWSFAHCPSLTTLTLPESLTSCGSNAFNGCAQLSTTTINGSGLVANAFANCTSINQITVGPKASSWDRGAFVGCGDGATVVNNSDKFSLNDGALFSLESGEQIYPYVQKDSVVTRIINASQYTDESGVFTVGETITSIGSGAFRGLGDKRITSINVESGNTSFVVDEQGVLYSADKATLVKAPSTIATITIPNTVHTIGQNAFQDCTNLQTVTIPEGCSVLSDEAFKGCAKLSSVGLPKTLSHIGNGAFEGTTLSTLIVPEGLWKNVGIDMGALSRMAAFLPLIRYSMAGASGQIRFGITKRQR